MFFAIDETRPRVVQAVGHLTACLRNTRAPSRSRLMGSDNGFLDRCRDIRTRSDKVEVFQTAAEKMSIRSAPKIGEPPIITDRISLNE